jgi:hypothetical protein
MKIWRSPRSRAIYFVDYDDGLDALLKSFLEHETSLGLRSVNRVDDQEHTVNHVHDALHLTAEI